MVSNPKVVKELGNKSSERSRKKLVSSPKTQQQTRTKQLTALSIT